MKRGVVLLDINALKSKLFSEFSQENCKYWFDIKKDKFLHNIDTFYYSIKLQNDFTADSTDLSYKRTIRYFQKAMEDIFEYGGSKPFTLLQDVQLNLRPFTFSRFYNICIECPDLYDIFIASKVPDGAGGESVTSEIVVQIRSYMLWMYGIHESFERSFHVVQKICDYFKLEISEVKENRVDYCWHSNYLQNPEDFFRIDRFTKMQVSRFKRVHMEYAFKPNDEYECDYVALGKRSDKCFVRIYLKSKEVVEQGYKPWFFKFWLFNGLINRYDNYVYEECFRMQKWHYVDMARIKFYSEYGTNQEDIRWCKQILNGEKEVSPDVLNRQANKLTPKITLITNVEFQTMRKMSKSFPLLPLKDNSKYDVARRVYDYIDNRLLITDYLTHSTLRLVQPEGDINKTRREYVAFWEALRKTKMIDCKLPNKRLKLIREYNRNLCKDIVKRKMLNNAITLGFYTRGLNEDDVLIDCTEALLRLNDNDIHQMKVSKIKKSRQYNADELSGLIEENTLKTYQIVDSNGLVYNNYNLQSIICQNKIKGKGEKNDAKSNIKTGG